MRESSREYLGNFLSGMETEKFRKDGTCEVSTLETSLVEWKPTLAAGMQGGLTSLGNFLSGMETSLLRSLRVDAEGLGNFLSGMETPGCVDSCSRIWSLGNFLSGMETRWSRSGLRVGRPLETSLVEWKLSASLPAFLAFFCTLETSLVEWKRALAFRTSISPLSPWKLP